MRVVPPASNLIGRTSTNLRLLESVVSPIITKANYRQGNCRRVLVQWDGGTQTHFRGGKVVERSRPTGTATGAVELECVNLNVAPHTE